MFVISFAKQRTKILKTQMEFLKEMNTHKYSHMSRRKKLIKQHWNKHKYWQSKHKREDETNNHC